MPRVFGIKQDIIKESQAYYDAVSEEDKEKSKENLKSHFKQFHYYRKSNKKDYKFIKKLIENIT